MCMRLRLREAERGNSRESTRRAGTFAFLVLCYAGRSLSDPVSLLIPQPLFPPACRDSCLFMGKALIEGWQDDQGQKSGGCKTSDDNKGERPLDFRTNAGGDNKREQSKSGGDRGLEHGPEFGKRTFDDRFFERKSIVTEKFETRDAYQSVSECDAEKSDKSDGSRDRPVNAVCKSQATY